MQQITPVQANKCRRPNLRVLLHLTCFQTLTSISFYLVGSLYPLTTEVNHPYGLALLHDHIYWTDWHTDAVYRADVNTGANIVLMAGNLGRPMDIHAYSTVPEQRKSVYYILQQYLKRGCPV